MADNTEKLKNLLVQKLEDADVKEVAGGQRLEIQMPEEAKKQFSGDGTEVEDAKVILEQDEDDKKESCLTMKLRYRVPKDN